MSDSKNKNKAKLIPVLILVLIIMLGLGLYLYKSYKIKNLGIQNEQKDDNNSGKETTKVLYKYDLSDYLKINKLEEDESEEKKYSYEYIVFTEKLDENLYEEYLISQKEFIEGDDSGYYNKELKSIAEIHDDLLAIYSIETHYIEDMPIFENINTLYIDLKENKVLDGNDFIAFFDYNLEGLLNKMLEDLVEKSKTNNYILPNGDHLSKEGFKENIPAYAQQLSQLEFPSIYLYLENGKLYMSYIESNVLSYISVDHTAILPEETVTTINLEII